MDFGSFQSCINVFPVPCKKVMTLISAIYKVDKETTEMTSSNQLPIIKKFSTHYGQTPCLPFFLMDKKLAEPNEPLGNLLITCLITGINSRNFFALMVHHLIITPWSKGLKIPIRGRKNWMFYKNTYGASVGGVLTSIIYTCLLSNVNPLNYLVAIQENQEQMIKNPDAWLPWCYQDTLSSLALAMAA